MLRITDKTRHYTQCLQDNMSQPQLQFHNGHSVPQFGFGCFAYDGLTSGDRNFADKFKTAISVALDAGYRHFDTAMVYQNEKQVGQAIREAIAAGKVKREELFVTSKVAAMCMEYDNAKAAIDHILKTIDLGYVDLLLIHHPAGLNRVKPEDVVKLTRDDYVSAASLEVDYMDTWKALEEAVNEGKVRSIGVSNFNHHQLQRVLDEGTIKPVTNQVECHPAFPQNQLKNWMDQRCITLTAYGPLQNASMFKNKLGLLEQKPILDAAATHSKTPAQVALRWSLQRGNIVIPKSSNPNRIKENIDIFDFELSKAEMDAIATLDQGKAGRLYGGIGDRTKHKHFPFHAEF